MDGGVIHLQDAKAGARDVMLGKVALDLLAVAKRNGPFVIPNSTADQPLAGSTLEDAWRRIAKNAGLTNARLHDLRHTVGTYAGQGGHNAFIVRDLLGHKTLAMTSRYVGRDVDPLRSAADDVSNGIAAALEAEAQGLS